MTLKIEELKTGNKVLGYHKVLLGSRVLVAGNITKINNDIYTIQGYTKELSGHLTHDEIGVINSDIFDEMMGIYKASLSLPRNYYELKQRFDDLLAEGRSRIYI